MRELGRQKPHIYKNGDLWACEDDVFYAAGATVKEAYEDLVVDYSQINTKLCSECRHSYINKSRFEMCSLFLVVSKYTPNAPSKRTAIVTRENELLCGPEAKHFEPIGGADGQD